MVRAGAGVIAHSEVSRHGPFPSHEAAVKAARRKRDTLLEFDTDDAEDAAKLAGTRDSQAPLCFPETGNTDDCYDTT